jgi:hypothetical protein
VMSAETRQTNDDAISGLELALTMLLAQST